MYAAVGVGSRYDLSRLAPVLDRPTAIGLDRYLAPLANWDGVWYERIATGGYDFMQHGASPIAFFPLYPLTIKALTLVGLPPILAGVAVSDIAIFFALAIVYGSVERHVDANAARWATIVLATFPYALFTGIVYTEALFLCLTAAALDSFDRGRYLFAGVFGALASATRVVGIMLVPAMLFAWLRDRRGRGALGAAVCSAAGLSFFMLFQYVHFGTPFAFISAQHYWMSFPGSATTWSAVLAQPLDYRWRIGNVMVAALVFCLTWNRLPAATIAYGIVSLVCIVFSGNITSIDRHVYAIVTFSMGLGIVLSRVGFWRYPAAIFFVIYLCTDATRFARYLWVA
jgi:Gpi18-like mannosyltransferase